MLHSQETDTKPEVGIHESMALQTYEFFDGGPERSERLDLFASGQVSRLELEYPQLCFNTTIDVHIHNLRSQVSEGSSVIATSEFRLAEAYFLKAAQRINGGERLVSQHEIDAFQELNECLYGSVDPRIVNQMLAQLWSKIDSAESPAVRHLKSDLESGFEFIGADGVRVEVPALPRPEEDTQEPLPQLSHDALVWLQEVLKSQYTPAREVFSKYYEKHSAEVDASGIGPDEVVALFRDAIDAQGLDVNVQKKTGARLLSWSSADNAVVVGGDRKPIKTTDELLRIFVHEVGVHGVRSMNGTTSGIEALGVGLFTEADELEDPSYLSFEEGLAATLQAAVSGKSEKWGVAGMGLYLTVALASAGWNPRQIQETMYRARLVVAAKSVEEVLSPEKITKAQSSAATDTMRVFRGTPADSELRTSKGVVLHYAKDIAYAGGKIKAICELNRIALLPPADRDEQLSILLSAKYDPTNHRQKALVESAIVHDKVEV